MRASRPSRPTRVCRSCAIERPLVRYHGVELVAEVELNAGTDLYLVDHALDGNLLFPAVFGMEAMAQVTAAVTGRSGLPVIEQAEFVRPIVVPPDGATTVRIAAAVTDDDTVEVAIRSAETGFAVEHFRARLRFCESPVPEGPPHQVDDDLPVVSLDPARDLYGDLLFQGQRFQRLRRFHRVAARHVDADIASVGQVDWFARFQPAELLLGDPGLRDALMHGNQVCVPNATLLPAAIERVYPGGSKLGVAGELRFCATERSHDGDTYVYDIAVRADGGDEVLERWEGLRLQAVRKKDGRGPWAAPLLGPYLERALADLLGVRMAVVVEPDGGDRDRQHRSWTAAAAARALGRRTEVRYRPDGRPEVDGDQVISASHGAGVTLCVVARGTVGCDVEPVVQRSEAAWAGLLGPHVSMARLITDDLGEDVDTASTRVWAVLECLHKVGLPPHTPLTYTSGEHGGWLIFASGTLRIATLVTTLRDTPDPVVFAVLTDGWS